MPAVARKGDSLTTGHLCDATSILDTPSQSTVFAESELVARIGDSTVVHNIEISTNPLVCAPHVETIIEGSATVFAVNEKVARIGDAVDAGNITSGASSVFAGDTNSAYVDILLDQMNFSQLVIEEAQAREIMTCRYRDSEEGIVVDEKEPLEYGDGGVGGSSPNTGQTGAVPAMGSVLDPSPDPDPSPFPPPSPSGNIIFLPHTDPSISPTLLSILESIAVDLGTTLTITSAYRSPTYNASVGGARNSMHTQGLAVDVVQRGLTQNQRIRFVDSAIDHGIQGIGMYNTFTHLDIGGKRHRGPNGSYRTQFSWIKPILRSHNYPNIF